MPAAGEEEEEEEDEEDDNDEDDDDDDDDDDEEDDDDDDTETSSAAQLDSARGMATHEQLADEVKYLKPPPGVDEEAFYCAEISSQGLPKGPHCPTFADIASGLNTQEGFWVPREKLQADLAKLRETGLFKQVEAKVRRCTSASAGMRLALSWHA